MATARKRWYDNGLVVLTAIIFFVMIVSALLWAAIKFGATSEIANVHKDTPIFNYLTSTIGLAVGFVAAAATVLLALRAIGISREQTVFASQQTALAQQQTELSERQTEFAREQTLLSALGAFKSELDDFQDEYHKAEALLISVADRALEYANACSSYAYLRYNPGHELPTAFTNDLRQQFYDAIHDITFIQKRDVQKLADTARQAAIYSIQNEDEENRFGDERDSWETENHRRAIEEFPFVRAEDEKIERALRDALGSVVAREIKAGLAALNQTDFAERAAKIEETRLTLQGTMSEFLRYIQSENRTHIFRAMVGTNLDKADLKATLDKLWTLEKNKFEFPDAYDNGETVTSKVDDRFLPLDAFANVCFNPSVLTDIDPPSTEHGIPVSVGRDVQNSFRNADYYLPKFGLLDGTNFPPHESPVKGVLFVTDDETSEPEAGTSPLRGVRASINKLEGKGFDQLFGDGSRERWPPFSVGLVALSRLLNRDQFETILNNYLRTYGVTGSTSDMLAKNMSKSFSVSPVSVWYQHSQK